MVVADASAEETPPAEPPRDMGARLAAGAAIPSTVELGPPAPFDSGGLAAPPGGETQNELVIAPIPIVNPTIGNGLALGAIYVISPRRNDTKSEPTTIGGGGFYTDSGSWGAAAGFKTSLQEDRFRLLGGLAAGDVNYDFFGVGEAAGDAGYAIPVKQEGWGGMGEILYALRGDLFAGVALSYGKTTSSIERTQAAPGIPVAELDASLAAVRLRVQSDERDSSFYPERGHLLDLKGQFFEESLGSDFTYQKYTIDYNHYVSVGDRTVIALRGYGCAVSGRTPFFDLCLFGVQSDLRGYDGGQYRDKAMFATQAEWRRELPSRFGVVVFAGVGEVMDSFTEVNMDDLLPAAGIGLRWMAARQNHINLRVDYAVGRDNQALYVAVGEAF